MNNCEKYDNCVNRKNICHKNDCKECPGEDNCGCVNCTALSIESQE